MVLQLLQNSLQSRRGRNSRLGCVRWLKVWLLMQVLEEGKVTVRVSMPGVASMAEVALDMSATELSVEVPGVYSLRVSLPCAVDVEAVRAKFRKKAQQLQVSVPCLAWAGCGPQSPPIDPQSPPSLSQL